MAKRSLEASEADFSQAVGLLLRRIRAAAASQELSLTEASVLKRLEQGGAASTAELARAERMKPQSMGETIGALEEMGLVTRKAHPTDGRQFLIQLTEKGVAHRKKVVDAKRSWIAHAVAQLNEDERETLFKAGEIIRRLAESDGK